MSHRPAPARLGIAALLAFATLGLAGPVAAAGPAPLLDGWRPAPEPAPTLTIHVIRHPEAGTAPGVTRGDQTTHVTAAPLTAADGIAASTPPCRDRKFRHIGGRWEGAYRWTYRARTTPPGLKRWQVIRVLKRSANNITRANNDCGRADRIRAVNTYLGTANRAPGPTRTGGCAAMDGYNAVGFGRLPGGIAGLTCIWTRGDRIVEADIKLDRDARWAITLRGCSFAAMLEAVATHEFGHAFGMGHVGEARHGRLTMSERLDGYCQNSESTLGLGDMLGLEALY